LSSIESLISRFVEDVLRLIREAKVEDLLDLVAAEHRSIPPLQDPIDDDSVDAIEPDEAPVTRIAPVRHVTPARVPPARRIPPVTRIGRRSPAPTVEEITDPASLLAMAPESESSLPAPPAPPTLPTLLMDPTDEAEAPPPSSNTESRVLVRLNSNETVARSSNAGIVIRRRKI